MAWNLQSWQKSSDVDELVDLLVQFGRRRGYKTTSGGPGVIELQKTSALRLLTGLTSGVRLVITTAEGRTSVEFREHIKEYVAKAPVFLVALMFFPLVAMPAFGAYQQYTLLEDLRKELNDYFGGALPLG